LFGTWSKTRFITQYCKKVPDKWAYSGYKFTDFKNTDELKKIFSKCSIKHRQEEVAKDLPELTFTDYFADVRYKDLMHFSPEDAEEIKKAVLEGKEFGKNYQADLRHNALLKAPAVLELLEGYPPDVSVVIFAWHREVVEELYKEIKDKTERTCEFITGEVTSEEKRQKIIDSFQAGECNTLVLNIQSGGVGITLTKATKAIYVQFPSSVIHWVQSQKRVHRIGSKKPVQIVKVMIEKSIDEDIFNILEERMKYVDEVGV
jgi:superfamily II DNA or RNA helicase